MQLYLHRPASGTAWPSWHGNGDWPMVLTSALTCGHPPSTLHFSTATDLERGKRKTETSDCQGIIGYLR